jgi:small subunit ribosomal protein S24e
MHPSSVNHRKREIREDVPSAEKQLFAYAEKRQNISAPAGAAQTYLITTTRLDPMTYTLFGAYDLEVVERGLECDGWLPIYGNVDALDNIQVLKTLLESCMLRVFEGITMGRLRRQRNMPTVLSHEEEAESGDDDNGKDHSLSSTEVKELDHFTRDIVRVLNRYSEERIASQSRQNSRPATPMGSPSLSSVRLPGGPPRSGYATPFGVGSAYNSRPGTPSRLSRGT